MSQPHLVLHWTFDIPNQKLYTKLADNLEYEALKGGYEGYNKKFNGETTHVTPLEWETVEKPWISENYGETYGYYQFDESRTKMHPTMGWEEACQFGLGPDGNYLDHMQRMQIVLEGHDMATIFVPLLKSTNDAIFLTPDRGLTIYKRFGTRDVMYPTLNDIPDSYWPDWSQPCMMQPYSKGSQLSNHDELLAAGCPQEDVDKCKRGEWDPPNHPELQQYYIYPTL